MPESIRLPSRDECVIRNLLIRRAAEVPDRAFVLFEDGERWTYAEALALVRRFAAGLDALGVRPGHFVLSWQGNGPTAVKTFLALNFLGAVYVPINTSYRGALLEHVVKNSGARLMIADGRLIDRLAVIDSGALEAVLVLGDERPALPGLELISRAGLDGASAATNIAASTAAGPPVSTGARTVVSTGARTAVSTAARTVVSTGARTSVSTAASTAASTALPQHDIAPWDTHMVIYTSGTTGPSKGVLSSYIHSYTAALGFRNIGPGDRTLMQLPMFHVGGPYTLLWALIHGGSTVVVDAFSVSRFWDIVRRYEITTVGLLGAMTQFLMKQPESPQDKDHPLRSVIIAPFDENAIAFGKRFAVPTYTEFNMTELSVPLWAGPNPTVPGTCGRAQAGVELRLVDEHDIEVPPGAAGELVVRADLPWTLSHGYLNDAEATAKAWRNGWFHTGDLFRRDADGNYFFVDRLKDALRRRGENISSFEVETAILGHPAVREAAVVPVPGDGAEDEVLAVIAPAPGRKLEPAELIDFLRDKLPYFMIPRFVRVLDALPRTPTQKVEKHVLRTCGVTPDTWDRIAAGIHVERDRLAAR